MNKKTKWGIIILIGAGIIGGGIYSQLPKTNDELAAADKVKNTQKNGKKITSCQSQRPPATGTTSTVGFTTKVS